MNKQSFWEQTFLASIRSGNTTLMAKRAADAAVQYWLEMKIDFKEE